MKSSASRFSLSLNLTLLLNLPWWKNRKKLPPPPALISFYLLCRGWGNAWAGRCFSFEESSVSQPEEPGRLQSMGSLRVRHDWATSLSLHFRALEKEMATHSSVLAWRIPGMGEPDALLSMGSHRVGHDWSDLAAATHKQMEEGGICISFWLLGSSL